jgi:hypothetical protein
MVDRLQPLSFDNSLEAGRNPFDEVALGVLWQEYLSGKNLKILLARMFASFFLLDKSATHDMINFVDIYFSIIFC